LKKLVEELNPALVTIYQKSMDEGVVSEDWRETNVT
jgi:hypothetical protein